MLKQTRRELLGSAALAVASAALVRRRAWADAAALDEPLRTAAEAGRVPGIVAWPPMRRAPSTRAPSAGGGCPTGRR